MAHPIPSGCWCYVWYCLLPFIKKSPQVSSHLLPPSPTLARAHFHPEGGEATWQRQRCIGPVKSENLNNNTEHRVLFITFASAFRRRFS